MALCFPQKQDIQIVLHMSTQKIGSLELLRLLATIGVIGDHVPLCTVKYFSDTATDMDKLIYFGCMMFCHWPVPVFMMITGYLMRNKKILDYPSIWKYFKRISILLLLFGFTFALMELYFNDKTFSLAMLQQASLNVLEGNTWKHLWYLYMLLGIYLILPVLHSFITPPSADARKNLLLLTLIILFSSIIPFFNLHCGINFPLCSVYVAYAIIGFLLSKIGYQQIRKLRMGYIVGIMLVTFLLIFWEAYDLYINNIEWTLKMSPYTSPIIIVQSTCIFIIAMKMQPHISKFVNNNIVKRLNRCSLGIYIIHMVWVNLALKVLHINIMTYNYAMIIVAIIVVFLLSWLTTEVMLRIPIIKKYL